MIELRLRSGPVIAFDGRVLEIFDAATGSRRFHIRQLETPEPVEDADGVRTLSLAQGSLTLSFAPDEAPGCERLVAAIADARA